MLGGLASAILTDSVSLGTPYGLETKKASELHDR